MTSSNPLITPNWRPLVHKTWFTRNWKWFVPCFLVAGFVGFAFCVVLFVTSLMKNSYAYQFAVERAKASEAVGDRLGRPLTVGRLITGEINLRNSDGEANLKIPISGPKGRGSIFVIAEKHNHEWTFKKLYVMAAGSNDVIPLLEPVAPAIQKDSLHSI